MLNKEILMKLFGKSNSQENAEELQARYNRLRDKEESGMLDPAGRAELDELCGNNDKKRQ